MFDQNFTFGTQRSSSFDSNTDSSTRDPSRSVSPCTSPTSSLPAPRFSVTDLAATLANSRLRSDARIYHDCCANYANMDDDDASWEIPPADERDLPSIAYMRTFPSRPHSPSRRQQRQANSRLLCSTSHAKEISTLVSRMVDCKEQCTVVTAELGPALDVDEGYTSDGTTAAQSRRSSAAAPRTRVPFRRSFDMKTSGACVTKSVRFRKKVSHKRIRSAEGDAASTF